MSYSSIYNVIGLNNEIDRLKVQAKLGWDKEFRTLKWLGLIDGMKILDAGAGPGFYTELLLENLPNCKITALEYDEKLMEVAKKRLSSYGRERVDFKKSSIIKSGLQSETYDFVICRFVYQHLDKPNEATREIYRLLKPGGIVAIIDSDRGLSGVSDPDFIMRNGRGFLAQLEKRAGWNREVGRKLLKILKNNGFCSLDFEAVTVHSDLIGVKNLMGYSFLSENQIRMINRYNPRLAKIMKLCKDCKLEENCTIILLNLIAKGVKM